MTPARDLRHLKVALFATIAAMIVVSAALLVWRSANFRHTAENAQNLHLRSVYLATGIIGDLALARIAIIEPGSATLQPDAYVALARRQLDELRILDARFGESRWRYLLTQLQSDLTSLDRAVSTRRDIATAARLSSTTAEQIKRAHWIEYEEHVERLLAVSRTDRRILVAFAVLLLIGTFIAVNWLIDRLAETNRARLAVIRDLERKNDELTRFSYAVSHDLKGPLITIGGFADLLDTDLVNGDLDTARADAQRIHNGIQRMQGLLDDVLALSVAGKSVRERQPVDLAVLVREVVGAVCETGRADEVRFEIDSKLPTVAADRDRLFEALQNLVGNAVKFMGDQPDPLVRIGQQASPGEMVFFVSDNGSGIEPVDIDRVFVLFERLETGAEGTGIGLALARRIIEAHGGTIWVESAGPGQGSTFFFTLGP